MTLPADDSEQQPEHTPWFCIAAFFLNREERDEDGNTGPWAHSEYCVKGAEQKEQSKKSRTYIFWVDIFGNRPTDGQNIRPCVDDLMARNIKWAEVFRAIGADWMIYGFSKESRSGGRAIRCGKVIFKKQQEQNHDLVCREFEVCTWVSRAQNICLRLERLQHIKFLAGCFLVFERGV